MSGISYMTQEGYDKVRAELDLMKTKGRDTIAKSIGEAREKGDLSENAEYDAAKDAQGMLEMKINKMEKALVGARIISADQLDDSAVTILSKVTMKNVKNGSTMSYTLVSESEANLKEKKISVNSPIGKRLLGKAVGDIAQVHTPGGEIDFEIIEIKL